jgi:hypothetical protein
VASGRSTCAPVSVASAIGTKPREPTSAVIMTGGLVPRVAHLGVVLPLLSERIPAACEYQG